VISTLLDGSDRWTSLRLSKRRPALDGLADVAAWGNGVPVWAAIAAVLAARGGRARAVAARAAASYGAASLASNLVVKVAVERRRPGPIGRRGPAKSTSSFPSSHAATAAAFSASVTFDWPAAGIPTLVLASAVAGSRVYARQHHVSDVLAGLGLGVAVAATVHRLSPADRRTTDDDDRSSHEALVGGDGAVGRHQ
jgi:undecaprenyl-diphosphatase